jgi:hypothetical protein
MDTASGHTTQKTTNFQLIQEAASVNTASGQHKKQSPPQKLLIFFYTIFFSPFITGPSKTSQRLHAKFSAKSYS